MKEYFIIMQSPKAGDSLQESKPIGIATAACLFFDLDEATTVLRSLKEDDDTKDKTFKIYKSTLNILTEVVV